MSTIRGRLLWVLACAFLPACITIEEDITLALDGSARVKIAYQIPQGFMKNQTLGEEIKKRYGLSLPLSPEEVRTYYAGIPGTKVENVASVTQNGLYRVEAALSCAVMDGMSQGPLSYSVKDLGGVKVFRIMITLPSRPREGGGSPPAQTPGTGSPSRVIQEVMAASERSVTLRVTTVFPTRVISSNGKISGRSVTWAAPLFTAGGAPPTVFEARFRSTPSLWDRIRSWLGFRS